MFKNLVFSFCLFFVTTTLYGQSQFGRYLGTVKHSQIAQDQLAKLDFVVSRQNSSEFKLIAILSLYFGGYDSNEYVTYHFDSVSYNILTGALVFDQPDQELTVIVERFGNGAFEGRLRSTTSGDVGTISLAQAATVEPARALVQPLWGEYRGECDGVMTALQIQTHRSTDDSSRMGNPFGTYEITAQMAEVNGFTCGDTSLCVNRVYSSGSYNFFNGRLDLSGQSNSPTCEVSADGISCNSCLLRRSSKDGAILGTQIYPTFGQPHSTEATPAVVEPTTGISGSYSGYLFHERLGVYQPVRLNVATFQAPGSEGGNALFVSATSALYFGGFDSPEVQTQRFEKREFPLLSPQIVLERISGDVDAIIQITELSNGTAKGVWYSRLFGRVGTFDLKVSGPPALPEGAKVMPKISGNYVGGVWESTVKVVQEATPINTVNPFFPLNFNGAFRMPDATPNIRISKGSFDFYTGKISFQLDNGTWFSGFRGEGDTLYLKRPTPGTIRPMVPHKPQSFIRKS